MEPTTHARFQEQIDAFKKKDIETYVVTTSKGYECLVKEAGIAEVEKLQNIVFTNIFGGTPDFIGFGKETIKNLWLTGDEEIRKDETQLVEAAASIVQIVKLSIATVKKN